MANEVRSVWVAEDRMSKTVQNIDRNVSRLDRTFTGFRARLVNAFQYRYIRQGFRLIEQGIYRVARAIPDLIGRGQAWLDVIDDITDATGMSARAASELAAVQRYVGGTTDGLARGLAAMARSAVENRDAWDAMGVATRNENGRLLDAGTILLNLRRRISETGQGLLSTAAAQKALSRAGLEHLDLLSLTDKQYRMIAQDAKRSGAIVTEAQLRQANILRQTQQRFEQTLDGLATVITTDLLPVLTDIIDGITKFIQKNLALIRQMAIDTVDVVAGILSALFGFEFGGISFAEEVDKAGKSARKHGPGLRDFSRDQERAKNETRDHAKELKRLREELRAAQRELAAARASDIFRPGVSGVDEALFDQARITRIRTARKRVADAEKALRRGRRGGGDGFEIPDATGRRLRSTVTRRGGGGRPWDWLPGAPPPPPGTSMARMFGEQVGAAILRGTQTLVDVLQTTAGHLSNLNNLLGGNGPLILGILALIKLMPGGGLIGNALGAYLTGRAIGGAGRSGTSGGLGVGGKAAGAAIIGAGIMAAARGLLDHEPRSADEMFADETRWLMRQGAPGWQTSHPTPPQIDWTKQFFDPIGGMPGGFGGGSGLAGFAQRYLLDSTFRKFFGPSSDLLRGQEDQSGLLSWLTANTQPMADGAVGVTNPQFPQIGRVTQWGAGTLDVWTPGGKKLPVEGDWDVKLGGSPANNIYETRKNTSKTVNLLAHWLPQINKRGVEIRNVLQSAQSGDTSLRVRVT